MVEISNDFADAIVNMIKERFAPDLLWAVTGENYKSDKYSRFRMKLRVSCPKCSRKWTSLYGVLLIYHFVNPGKKELQFLAQVFLQDCEVCLVPGTF